MEDSFTLPLCIPTTELEIEQRRHVVQQYFPDLLVALDELKAAEGSTPEAWQALTDNPQLKLTEADYTLLLVAALFTNPKLRTHDFLFQYDDRINSIGPPEIFSIDMDEEFELANQRWDSVRDEITQHDLPRIRAKLASLELVATDYLPCRIHLITTSLRYLACPEVQRWMDALQCDSIFARDVQKEEAVAILKQIGKAVQGDRRAKAALYHTGNIHEELNRICQTIEYIRTEKERNKAERLWRIFVKARRHRAEALQNYKGDVFNSRKKPKALAEEILTATRIIESPSSYDATITPLRRYLQQSPHSQETKEIVRRFFGFRAELVEVLYLVNYWAILAGLPFSPDRT